MYSENGKQYGYLHNLFPKFVKIIIELFLEISETDSDRIDYSLFHSFFSIHPLGRAGAAGLALPARAEAGGLEQGEEARHRRAPRGKPSR